MATSLHQNFVLQHAKLCHDNEAEFRRIFGLPLREFFDNLAGFNIVKFDDEVVKSGDDCMRDVVQARWGEPGVSLIYRLIGKPEEKQETKPAPKPKRKR
jgi:hypothetical protein